MRLKSLQEIMSSNKKLIECKILEDVMILLMLIETSPRVLSINMEERILQATNMMMIMVLKAR